MLGLPNQQPWMRCFPFDLLRTMVLLFRFNPDDFNVLVHFFNARPTPDRTTSTDTTEGIFGVFPPKFNNFCPVV